MRKNHSRQREEIRQAVAELHTHPTAEEVYEWVKERHSTASRSTVYRNLHELAEEGAIRSLMLPDDVQRFDGNSTKHHHAVCRVCKKIFDVTLELPELEAKLDGYADFHVSQYHLLLDGICPACAKQKGDQ